MDGNQIIAALVVVAIVWWLFAPGMSKNHDRDWWGF
jgi:hypothetical protein